jgi:hypothetical protein
MKRRRSNGTLAHPSHTHATRQVFVVTYPDPHDIAGLGVAYFDGETEAAGFAIAFKAYRITEETVPGHIADRWTFTRWSPS